MTASFQVSRPAAGSETPLNLDFAHSVNFLSIKKLVPTNRLLLLCHDDNLEGENGLQFLDCSMI